MHTSQLWPHNEVKTCKNLHFLSIPTHALCVTSLYVYTCLLPYMSSAHSCMILTNTTNWRRLLLEVFLYTYLTYDLKRKTENIKRPNLNMFVFSFSGHWVLNRFPVAPLDNSRPELNPQYVHFLTNLFMIYPVTELSFLPFLDSTKERRNLWQIATNVVKHVATSTRCSKKIQQSVTTVATRSEEKLVPQTRSLIQVADRLPQTT